MGRGICTSNSWPIGILNTIRIRDSVALSGTVYSDKPWSMGHTDKDFEVVIVPTSVTCLIHPYPLKIYRSRIRLFELILDRSLGIRRPLGMVETIQPNPSFPNHSPANPSPVNYLPYNASHSPCDHSCKSLFHGKRCQRLLRQRTN